MVELCEIEIHEARNDLWSEFHLNFDMNRTLFRHHRLFPLNFTTQIEFSKLFQVGEKCEDNDNEEKFHARSRRKPMG